MTSAARGAHGRAHCHELPWWDPQALHLPIDNGENRPLHERIAVLPAVVRPVVKRAVGVAQEEPMVPGVGPQHAQPVEVALELVAIWATVPPLAEEGAAMHGQALAPRMGDDGVVEVPAFGVGEAPEVGVQRRRGVRTGHGVISAATSAAQASGGRRPATAIEGVRRSTRSKALGRRNCNWTTNRSGAPAVTRLP